MARPTKGKKAVAKPLMKSVVAADGSAKIEVGRCSQRSVEEEEELGLRTLIRDIKFPVKSPSIQLNSMLEELSVQKIVTSGTGSGLNLPVDRKDEGMNWKSLFEDIPVDLEYVDLAVVNTKKVAKGEVQDKSSRAGNMMKTTDQEGKKESNEHGKEIVEGPGLVIINGNPVEDYRRWVNKERARMDVQGDPPYE
ncbi:OLC1v1011930C1 [Oldenlandia corymbosa var. corymbosa]|uniref:OLC1v1011930C1 n=1 Tax=Oldenlandia corymbosa var. corymbosa TaxID=529605 RepID=A0AAV1DWJ0_OLDCO|nr:OLC1v1011930C1 [Oldenlandia corymbosa var. corymbosa]